MKTNDQKFLPNAFILGAAKSGTTSLYAYIEDMPGVCMSQPKEPYFFECEFDKGLDFYRQKYFSHWQGEPIIGEARHRNLYLPYVPERIKKVNPEAKLLVIVRNPIERAFSHWWHLYRRGFEHLNFADAVCRDFERISEGWRVGTQEEMERYCISLFPHGQGLYRTYLDSGYYYEQIQRYLEHFPREQLKVVLLEHLIKQPKETIEDLARFIGVNTETYVFKERHENSSPLPPLVPNSLISQAYNRFVVRHSLPTKVRSRLREFVGTRLKRQLKTRTIDKTTREWLQRHYQAHNRTLGEFVGKDLSYWQ